jgi:hypothetical protein
VKKSPCRRRTRRTLLVLLLAAAGCATPESRIRRNPELFAGFPPDVQANVRKGRIDVGYTKPMVSLALGRPARIYDRQAAEGLFEIWIYTDLSYTSDFAPAETSYWYRGRDGKPYLARDWTWTRVQRPHEFESLRVEFAGEHVTVIERQR